MGRRARPDAMAGDRAEQPHRPLPPAARPQPGGPAVEAVAEDAVAAR